MGTHIQITDPETQELLELLHQKFGLKREGLRAVTVRVAVNELVTLTAEFYATRDAADARGLGPLK